MQKMTTGKMQKWVEQNVDLTLDQVTKENAEKLLHIAEEQTWAFLDLGKRGLKLKRKKERLPQHQTDKELVMFLLEFRVKLQLVRDGFADLPNVPLFDFGGYALLNSTAFKLSQMLYKEQGGRA